MKVTAIIAPPPTPNGDLHLGHLSGPYLGADVLRRYLALRGRQTVSAISVDSHQSYVATSAERCGIEPLALAEQSHADITKTLMAAQMDFDVVGKPDAEYVCYVRDWFSSLFAAGLFERKPILFPYDCECGRFLFEAFASGKCPTCLANTRGNICEDCGHPNDPRDLLDLHSSGRNSGTSIEHRSQTVHLFDLERYRTRIQDFLAGSAGDTLRPTQRRLLRELLGKALAPIPITFPGRWGLPAPFPASDGLILNPWIELLPGHHYWLEKGCRAKGLGQAITATDDPEYVQCVGFDNSFYYLVVHIALALAAREHGVPAMLPTAFCVNEFYLLGESKFSTSNGPVILGREFLEVEDADCLRFYLCRTNPELQRSSFVAHDFKATVAKELATPWQAILHQIDAGAELAADAREVAEANAIISRFELAYDSAYFSLRMASEVLCAGIAATLTAAQERRPFRLLAHRLAIGSSPIIPRFAREMIRRLGHAAAPVWPRPFASTPQRTLNLKEQTLE